MLIQSIVAASVRCYSQFASLADLVEHRLATPCRLQYVLLPPERDVEDGITPDVAQRLLARSSRDRVATWEDLWTTLFPDDLEIPSSGTLLPPFLPEFRSQSLTSLDSMRKLHFDRDIREQGWGCGRVFFTDISGRSPAVGPSEQKNDKHLGR